jgi:hypothetical protein
MVPEKLPFDEAMEVLANIIAQEYLHSLTEKISAHPRPEIKPLPVISSERKN